MIKSLRFTLVTALLGCLCVPQPSAAWGEQVAVRHAEGLKHGFLALRSLDGKLLADGELTQTTEGDRVTDRLIFRFKDRSTYDETTVFSQRGSLRLLSDHVDEKGPAFAHAMETSIDTSTGRVTVRSTGDDGKEETIDERLNLPADLANGLLLILVKNIAPNAAQTTVSLVVFTPKPRLVGLAISPQGEGSISDGGIQAKTVHYVMQFKIGVVVGLFAALTGKKPADLQAWVLSGRAPELVRFEGQLYADGPVWRIELAAPEVSATP